MTTECRNSSAFQGQNYLFAALAASNVGAGLFVPVAFLYFTTHSGISIAEVGLAFTIASLCALPIAIPAGAIADASSPKRLLLLNAIGNAVFYSLYILSESFIFITLSVFLVMAVDRLYYAAWAVLTNTVSDKKNIDGWFSRTEVINNTAMGFGSIIGTIVAYIYGESQAVFSYLLYGNILALLVAVMFLSVFVSVTPRYLSDFTSKVGGAAQVPNIVSEASWSKIVESRYLMWFMFGQALIGLGWALPTIVFPLFYSTVLNLPLSFITATFSVHWLLQIVLQRRITRWTSLVSRRNSILLSSALLVASLLTVGLMGNLSIVGTYMAGTLAVVLASVATMVYVPAANSLVLLSVPSDLRGRAGSAFQLAVAAAAAVSPFLVGKLLEIGHGYLVLCLVCLLGSGGIVSYISCRGLPADAKGPPAGWVKEAQDEA